MRRGFIKFLYGFLYLWAFGLLILGLFCDASPETNNRARILSRVGQNFNLEMGFFAEKIHSLPSDRPSRLADTLTSLL